MMQSRFAPNRRQSRLLGFLTLAVCALASPIPAALAEDAEAPRDEFFWLGEMNKATAVINTEEGLLDLSLAPSIAKALQTVIDDGSKQGADRPRTVITFEPLLIEAGGQEVTLLHAGRSSQDMHATYRAAILRQDLLALAEQLHTTTRTLVDVARTNADTIVPNYTNGVAAQPNSYGHMLLGHAAGFLRDAERLHEAYARIDRSPMGTTVLNGTSWPLDRERMADYLGFATIVDNAYDASQISSMEQPVEVSGVVTTIALHTGNFVEDVMTQYAQTRPWILLEEGGGNTYVSSSMPQKRNPGLLNGTRSAASNALTLAMGPIFQTHNITPGMSDPKDVADNSAMVEAVIDTLARLDRVLKALKINPDRALQELNSDWTASQELADRLMREHGLPFREGHHFASEIVTFARANDMGPLDFPYAEAKRIYAETMAGTDHSEDLPLSEDAFRATLDPVAIVKNRATIGGPQPSEMTRMLAAADEALLAQETWIETRTTRIDDSLERLDKDFQALLTGSAEDKG
ncbi:argininosuccinate lyase [Fulvimarina endophytica]|uniref:argininosuccinate lyase n=1 Tax=Fulvimarina endophytica TaxID=2293836 RepID=A0A371X9U9_9HYPH|nr:lyase family protein [Fulvimarina endophytica]RFC65986.1 argininosuccinate lyase [Fulvimarina endophytica]